MSNVLQQVEPLAPAQAPLPSILKLAGVLEESGVRYCHWKSNAAIERSATGDNDLDLLVHREDVRRMTELLSGLGYTRARKPRASVPGIESFYGYDADADRLVHVHAHYQLVLGDDRTKNYRLPIEDAYLRSSALDGTFRVPAPELEYVVFVVRMVLKYCTWDEILWRALRGGRARPKRSEREELEYLRARIGDERVAEVVEEHLPFVGLALFADCVDAVAGDASAARKIRTARRLETSLQPHARYSRRQDRALRISRRVTEAAARRTRGVEKNRLAGGGVMVGIMGGDGSGKTTSLTALESWLAPEFEVRVVHLGKPRWSLTTFAVRAGLKALHLPLGVLERSVRVAPVKRIAELFATYRTLLWLLCTARDRRLRYRSARRFAMNGGIVLCDRYSHPRLTSMEVPLIASRTADRPPSRVVRAMIRLEQRYHRSIAPPELLVVLRLDPEIAVQRKTTESADSVRARGAEIWNIDWRDARAHVIDASQSEEAVARELKALVWSTLT